MKLILQVPIPTTLRPTFQIALCLQLTRLRCVRGPDLLSKVTDQTRRLPLWQTALVGVMVSHVSLKPQATCEAQAIAILPDVAWAE